MTTTLLADIERNLPYITVLTYGKVEYVGIVANQDKNVTCFFDLATLLTTQEKAEMLLIGELWWSESNHLIPITIFCRDEVLPYTYALKTFSSRDVTIVSGPVVNILGLIKKRSKRRTITVGSKR